MKKGLRVVAVILAMFMCVLMNKNVYAAEIVHSGTSGDLNWSIDSDGVFILEGDGEIGFLNTGTFFYDKDGNEIFFRSIDSPWLEYSDEIIHGKVRVKNVTSLAGIFLQCKNLETVDFTGSDTSKVTNFGSIFAVDYIWTGSTNKLKSVDLSMLDTSSAIVMTQLFWGCTKLESVNLTGWDTSNVTQMTSMFDCCLSLKEIKGLEDFDTSNVKDMSIMFQLCESLEKIDLSSWDTQNLKNMYSIFNLCNKTKRIDVSTWDVSNVYDFSQVFFGCNKLKYIDLSNWDMSKATDITKMFGNCYALSGSLNLNGNITAYDEALYMTNYKSKEPFVIRYSGGCSKNVAQKIYDTNNNASKNIYLIGKKGSVISLSKKTETYTGEPVNIGEATVIGSTGKVTYTYYTDKKCQNKTTKAGSGASGKGKAPVNVGTYYVKATVEADGTYKAATSKKVELVIKKATPKISVKTTKKTYKFAKVKKAKRSFNIKASVIGGGKLSYKKVSGSKNLTLNEKTGKVVVNKGTPKGTYKIKIKISAEATENCKAAEKTVTVKVTVK